MEEVVSFLQECRSTYNYIPHCNDVLLKLISENDTQNLQTGKNPTSSSKICNNT